MTKIFISVLTTFIILIQPSWASSSVESLKHGGEQYLDFMSQVGRASNDGYIAQMPEIFATECKKIENGNELLTTREELIEQLKNARRIVGVWEITTLNILPVPDQQTCVVHFQWDSETTGPHATMAILKFDDEMHIYEIVEMVNKFGDKKKLF